MFLNSYLERLNFYNLLPNMTIFDKLLFRMINLLSGIQFYKNSHLYFNKLNQEAFHDL